MLQEKGVHVRVIDLFSVSPVDKVQLLKSTEECHGRVMVIEDHFELGGLGDAVRRALTGHKLHTFNHKFVNSIPFSAKPAHLYKHYRFDALSIAEDVELLLK
mmetsp:Transcript_12680/g.27527  ORF Transcript_12680/g.27527 Transcript_12680/m.27527 type:complete len:102 (+) Transcript_12680:1581-1886(+)